MHEITYYLANRDVFRFYLDSNNYSDLQFFLMNDKFRLKFYPPLEEKYGPQKGWGEFLKRHSNR